MYLVTTFSNIGFLGINRMFDKVKVNYSRFSIVHASNLKERLKELKIKRDKVRRASVDAINMYLLIKPAIILKLFRLFARKLTTATKKTINLCLELIHFGMISTLDLFDGEYYKYHVR